MERFSCQLHTATYTSIEFGVVQVFQKKSQLRRNLFHTQHTVKEFFETVPIYITSKVMQSLFFEGTTLQKIKHLESQFLDNRE